MATQLIIGGTTVSLRRMDWEDLPFRRLARAGSGVLCKVQVQHSSFADDRFERCHHVTPRESCLLDDKSARLNNAGLQAMSASAVHGLQ